MTIDIVEMRKIKIMIIENESLVAKDIQKSLDNLGYSATISPDGGKALQEIEQDPPDLVLIDIVLQGEMDGIETSRQIRSRWDIPIVYITAYSDEKTVQAAKVTEPYGYIFKPIDEKQLQVSIDLSLYRHATEKKLRDRHERLSRFIDPATGTFCLLDSNFHVVEINERGLKTWRIKRKELKERNIFDLILNLSPAKRKRWREKLTETMNSGTHFFKYAVSVSSKAGDKIINVNAFKAGDGIGLIITDVTAQVLAEQALRRSEDRYRMLVENMNEGIAIIDKNGILSYINEKFIKMHGYVPEEVIGHAVTEFLDESCLNVFEEQMSKRKKGKHETYELVWKKRNGARASTLVSSTAIFEKGRFKGSVEVLTDITERRKAEEELSRSREQLRNLSRHLQSVREEESKRIALEIHDELGQSLTALKMDLSWMTSRFPEDFQNRKLLVEKTRAMASLIDKTIQTVQKISAELRPGLLDDLGLIPAIEWQTQEFQRRTAIDCQLELDCETIDLDSDRSTAIFRVFQEALTNIARHSCASRVNIRLKRRSDKLELQVTDNGVGITEKAIRAADSLGLMGMKERLHAFGGGLRIQGSPDKGTSLTVVLPLKESRER
jgi:two-component system sensor histidine kinase UhpB